MSADDDSNGGVTDEMTAEIEQAEIELKDDHLDVVAAERERIAGELHDDAVQVMTSVSLQLQRLGGRLEHPESIELLDRARALTDQSIDRLRHMLFVLHPSSLEDDGLVLTLEVYLESYVETVGVTWTIDHSLSEPEQRSLPLGAAALAFRLAREAISNAMRHGSPANIGVALHLDDATDDLCLTVADDGTGFDNSTRRKRAGHLGIGHCEALAEAALGSFAVTSAVGVGTTVDIRLPVTLDRGDQANIDDR